MLKIKDREEKKRGEYNDIFEERFQQKTMISSKKSNYEFFEEYLNKINKQYRNIIHKQNNNGNTDYKQREEIRLEVNIKNLEATEFRYNSLIAIMSSVLVIFTFGMGRILDNSLNTIKFSIDNSLKVITDKTLVKDLNIILKDYFMDVSNITFKLTIVLIIGTVATVIIQEKHSILKKNKCNMELAFNRMCLEILKKI